jgi:uracil-DNA glycosylase family 4
VRSYPELEELITSIKEHLGDNIYNLRFADKQIKPELSTKVLFVTDAYINESAIDTESPGISELCCFFHKEVAELFSRMIGAMGLVGDQFFVSSITAPSLSEEDGLKSLGSEIFHLSPKFIVTLGASATSMLLANDQRLKNIHGQLFDFKVSNQDGKVHESKLMPLFSPKLLHTAPNMKKTAWRDMQKLIELL